MLSIGAREARELNWCTEFIVLGMCGEKQIEVILSSPQKRVAGCIGMLDRHRCASWRRV